MTDIQDPPRPAAVQQNAHAADRGTVLQIGGDYEHHEYVYEYHAWRFLRAVPVTAPELVLARDAYAPGSEEQKRRLASLSERLAAAPQGHRALVLLGAPGTGRRTAALHLLSGLYPTPGRICDLELDWDRPRLDQVPRTPAHAFLLDLSAYSTLPETLYADLAGFAGVERCTLVVLATAANWKPTAPLAVPTLTLEPVPAKQVAHAHLVHQNGERVAWLTDPLFTRVLRASAPPGEGARLARIITDAAVPPARDGQQDDDQAAREQQARERVKDEFTNWHDLLIDWFSAHETPADLPTRALLISAALLNEQPTAVVLDAADALYEAVCGAPPPGGALGGPDIEVRIRQIHAVVDGDILILDRHHHGLHDAALAHVWAQRPQLRKALLDWASAISGPRGVAERHLERVARALTTLAEGPGGLQALSVITDWVGDASPARRRLAVEVLGDLVDSAPLGADIRQRLYAWATQKSATDGQRDAVAELCAGALGRRYPRSALTRLRHLAAQDDPRIVPALGRAMRALVEQPALREPVTREIAAWTTSHTPAIRTAGIGAFLALVDPADGNTLVRDLLREPAPPGSAAMRDLLVAAWRTAASTPASAERAHALLRSLLAGPEQEVEPVVDLAEAVLRERLGADHAFSLLTLPQDASVPEPGVVMLRRRMFGQDPTPPPAESPPAL